MYLKADQGGATTGLAAALDIETELGMIVAGFSFWPLGWIMTIGDVTTVRGTLDVSGWTELDYNAGPITTQVPCQWAISPYPGDFRGPDEFPHDAWSIQRPEGD